jgi:hypothetical protein
MGVSAPRNIFGIHSILFYRRSDGSAYGPPLKVLASGGVDLPADFEDLTGGSEKFVLASEPKAITPEMKVTTKDYADYLYELFMGATVTKNAAELSGNVSTAVNKKGTSVVASTGLASVIVIPTTGAANLKFARYLVVAKSATTVNILASTDIDFRRGSTANYQNDDLELIASDVTITTGANTDVANIGIRLVGGAGTIAMVAGDTAEFEVRPPNAGSSIIDIGDVGTTFPEFGAVIYAQKRGSGEMFEIECFRCIGAGLPHNFEEKVFAQAELTIKVLKDFSLDKVMRIRAIGF